MEFLSLFFQMKLSSTLSAVMIFGIISLSSANRIPPHQLSCVTYCGNYEKHCDLQLDCPLDSCDVGDRDCFFNECMTYLGCHIQRKREKSDAIVEAIWGSKALEKENNYFWKLNRFTFEGVFLLKGIIQKVLFLHFVWFPPVM